MKYQLLMSPKGSDHTSSACCQAWRRRKGSFQVTSILTFDWRIDPKNFTDSVKATQSIMSVRGCSSVFCTTAVPLFFIPPTSPQTLGNTVAVRHNGRHLHFLFLSSSWCLRCVCLSWLKHSRTRVHVPCERMEAGMTKTSGVWRARQHAFTYKNLTFLP